MAPLAKASTLDQAGIQAVLSNLNSDDADLTYQAIAKANAGGLGEVEGMDVRGQAPDSLLEAMNCAKERDFIAAQYTNQFDDVLSVAAPKLRHSQDLGLTQPNAIVRTHVELMSLYPDSLIARKCGIEVANESASRAAAVLAQASSGQEAYVAALSDLDFWLRTDGHRRNPGTTADIIGASILVGLIEGWLEPPIHHQV